MPIEACAEQSVVQQTLDACTSENVEQMRHALDEIYRAHGQGFHHNYQTRYQLLDVDMSAMPCGPKAAFATKGYFAGHNLRRGRQLGRVLAIHYEEVVVDQLYAGNVQLRAALQPLVEAAETTLQFDEIKRRRTIIRLDAGAGTEQDLNWLLERGYEIMGKEYSGRRVARLARLASSWVQDPTWPERSFGWVSEDAGYARPVRRMVVRCCRSDGTFAYGVLICSLSLEQVFILLGWQESLAHDPVTELLAYATFYDQQGGGIETTLKGDRQGWGLTRRNKKRFDAQYMQVLLGSLTHNVVVWTRNWLALQEKRPQGMLRMVRDVFHVSGVLGFDEAGSLAEIAPNPHTWLAHRLIHGLQGLLAPPSFIVVTLGET